VAERWKEIIASWGSVTSVPALPPTMSKKLATFGFTVQPALNEVRVNLDSLIGGYG
jgi:hypothetical protein